MGRGYALALREVPGRLLVVGGGYIGLELGTFYAKIGSKVTVVEMLDGLLPSMDRDIVRLVARGLKGLGVKVHVSSRVKGLSKTGEGLKAQVEGKEKGKMEKIPADRVLVAAGRRPCTGGMGLEKTGVDTNERGFIETDSHCRTSVPHIYAIGDVAGEPMLAHKASKEGIVAAEVVAGMDSACDWQAVPAVIFTDPEIAVVGVSEEEAGERGIEVAVGRFPFSASGRAMTMNRAEGFVKVIADKSTRRIIGVRIVGPEASTMISEAALAVEMAATLDDLSLTVHPHPTLPESLMEAAEAAERKAIHILNR
jgi:dihydrolipoamide dehydrogenase